MSRQYQLSLLPASGNTDAASTFVDDYVRGVRCEDQEDADGAEAAFRAAIASDPSSVEARVSLGLLLEKHRKGLDGAEAAYRSAIEVDSTNPSGYLNLGLLLELHRSDIDGATAAYRLAARHGSNNAGIREKAVLARIGMTVKSGTRKRTRAVLASTTLGLEGRGQCSLGLEGEVPPSSSRPS